MMLIAILPYDSCVPVVSFDLWYHRELMHRQTGKKPNPCFVDKLCEVGYTSIVTLKFKMVMSLDN